MLELVRAQRAANDLVGVLAKLAGLVEVETVGSEEQTRGEG
jgi:hypothetical protein